MRGPGTGTLVGLIVGVLVLASVAMVVAVDRIQTALLERDAISLGLRWTNGLAAHLDSLHPVLRGETLSESDHRTIALASRLGGLRDFVIFNQEGRAIASSSTEEIGRVNTSAYWADQVLRGEPHVALETGQGAAGDLPTVVAETYLPVFDPDPGGKRVIGAFEAYLDVTASAEAYRRLGRYMSVVGVVLIFLSGGIAIAFVWRNAAHRSEREQALAIAREAAETANDAKSRFLATMSHEIRTPMSGVMATLELLERTSLAEAQREMVTVVRRSAATLLDLLNQILDLSKIEAGKLDLAAAPFELKEVVENAVAIMRPAALGKSVTLDVKLAEGLPAVVEGDQVRLRQIVLNLLGNAIKFTEVGGVTVSVEGVPECSGEIAIAVTDTGIGMEAEVLERLFQPFEQADRTTSGRYGGTGLGLAVSRQLAELMGGAISVSSRPGAGSSFRLVLPLPASDRQPDRAPAADFAPPQLGLSVLVADDDPTNRWVLERQLAHLGCSATLAGNGAEALELWRSHAMHWHALITDWHMPEMTGPELLAALKREPRLPGRMILMTAAGLAEDVAAARRSGADNVLIKPVSLQALADALGHVAKAPDEDGTDLPQGADSVATLDLGDLAELCGGNEAILSEALGRFSARLEASLEILSEESLSERIAAEAHKLKGAAASVGALRLAAAAGDLEVAARQEDGSLQAEQWQALLREADILRDALAARLPENERSVRDGSL